MRKLIEGDAQRHETLKGTGRRQTGRLPRCDVVQSPELHYIPIPSSLPAAR